LNRIDRSPRDSPPAEHQDEQNPGEATPHTTFAFADEVKVRASPEGDDNHRNAILVEDKLAASLNLEIKLVCG
jgi:hypothetical protein